ncbi:DUF3846 domain-containing protein [Ureibacillus endophyticus]|uniref:DUF3846 domain-containing protein n=1 Tax=Ureibacillus endophyticus TaxID=1978490 RepID=A0A494Z8I8_9BACL|nr:DUF3846 domain-containing protein [Lysinibacillus endophyticus]RKQ18926.1 DUF3846 domain-containing protein [Lysinibacillus endophyticus]
MKFTINLHSNEVGGYIERIPFIDEFERVGIDVWINEEGKLIGLPSTLRINDSERTIDIICGNIVFTRCDDEGNTIGLKDEDIELIKRSVQKKSINNSPTHKIE